MQKSKLGFLKKKQSLQSTNQINKLNDELILNSQSFKIGKEAKSKNSKSQTLSSGSSERETEILFFLVFNGSDGKSVSCISWN